MSDTPSNEYVRTPPFPRKQDNRPGLSSIEYRIGTYTDFREALLKNLNDDPVLRAWTYRGRDDPGIALLEGASVLGDILTFYQELYANEVFLRTAKWRESIGDLVRPLGYLLSPGLGGEATFSFEVRGDKSVTIPKGLGLQAQLSSTEQQSFFETSEQIIAYPKLSKFNLYHPMVISPVLKNKTETLSLPTAELEQSGSDLRKGDRLMLIADIEDPASHMQLMVVKGLKKRFDRTEVQFTTCWHGNDIQKVSVYKLGRTFHHFGHNCPETIPRVRTDGLAENVDIDFILMLSRRFPSGEGGVILGSVVPLDSGTDLAVGIDVLVHVELFRTMKDHRPDPSQGMSRTYVRKAVGVASTTMTWHVVSGSTTLIKLDQALANEMDDAAHDVYVDIRHLEVLEVIGGRMVMTGPYINDAASNPDRLVHFGDPISYSLLKGRALSFVKGDIFDTIQVKEIDPTVQEGEQLRPVVLSRPLNGFVLGDFPLDAPKVQVFGNLVNAAQGRSEKVVVLGNGDIRAEFQTFKLPKSPLTYLYLVDETPPMVPQLEVYVSGRRWTRVGSFFGHGPKEEIYIVREDGNGDSWVQFGDGTTGARLPSGVKNVTALFRTGHGAYGGLKDDTSVHAGSSVDRLDRIDLIGTVTGGSQPEIGDNAREAAPGKVQSLGRLVSLRDFEVEAISIPGVLKALASWKLDDNVPAIFITVMMENGREREFDKVRTTLVKSDRSRGTGRFPLKVQQGVPQPVELHVRFTYDPSYAVEEVKSGIRGALGASNDDEVQGPSSGLFAIKQRRFGQKEYVSRIEAVVQNVEGVQTVTVSRLVRVAVPEGRYIDIVRFPQKRRTTFRGSYSTVSCDDDQVLVLNERDLRLTPVLGSRGGIE